jgi:hypothetical protein
VLARDLALVLVLAQPAQAVVLLGDVGELEEQPKRPQRGSLPLDREPRHALGECTAGGLVAFPAAARERAEILLEVEQPLPLLLDEHTTEQLAEQPHVGAQTLIPLHETRLTSPPVPLARHPTSPLGFATRCRCRRRDRRQGRLGTIGSGAFFVVQRR